MWVSNVDEKRQNFSLKLNEPQIAENQPLFNSYRLARMFFRILEFFYPSVLKVGLIKKNKISPSDKCIYTKVQTYWPTTKKNY